MCSYEACSYPLILLVLVVLNIYSCKKKNELPIYSDFAKAVQYDPIQTPTKRPPFTVEIADQTHTVKPLFEYRIAGMVVSSGFSKNMEEYRHDDLNIMDAGIIWGSNLHPEIYRNIKFYTAVYGCMPRQRIKPHGKSLTRKAFQTTACFASTRS